MPRDRAQKCQASLHDLTDPANLRTWYDPVSGYTKRGCRPCNNAARRKLRIKQQEERAARRTLEWIGPRKIQKTSYRRRHHAAGRRGRITGGAMKYAPTVRELGVAQRIADGDTVAEIATQEYLTIQAVTERMRRLQLKWGVDNRVAMVAQGLKRGLIEPDKAKARELARMVSATQRMPGAPFRKYAVKRYLRDRLTPTFESEIEPFFVNHGNSELSEFCWALEAKSECHAISILWAAQVVTSRDVPQTRNNYVKRP